MSQRHWWSGPLLHTISGTHQPWPSKWKSGFQNLRTFYTEKKDVWLLGITTTTAVSPKCTHHNPGGPGALRWWWRNLSVPPPTLLFLSTFAISPLPPSIRSGQYHPLISNSRTLPQSDVFTQIWDRSHTGAISLGAFHKKLLMQPILELNPNNHPRSKSLHRIQQEKVPHPP